MSFDAASKAWLEHRRRSTNTTTTTNKSRAPRQWLTAAGGELQLAYAGRQRLLVCWANSSSSTTTSTGGQRQWRRVRLVASESGDGDDDGDNGDNESDDDNGGDSGGGDENGGGVVKIALNGDASLLLLVTRTRACRVVELNQRFYHELRRATNTAASNNSNNEALSCRSFALGDYWHATHAGVRVLDARWHPLALDRCAVLTSDHTLRLYDAGSPARAADCESLVRVALPATAAAAAPPIVAFAFGHDGGAKESWREAWALFAVYFLTADARLFALCPVVPRSCLLPAHLLAELADQTHQHDRPDQAEHARLWLRRSTGRVVAAAVRVRADDAGAAAAADWVRFEPAGADAPQLQGPLALAPAAAAVPPLRATALECVSGGAPTVLVVACSSGLVHAYVGIEPLQPRWQLASRSAVADARPLLHLYEQLDLALDVPLPQRNEHTVLLTRIGGADDALLALHGDGAHLVRVRWLAALRRWCRDALLGDAPRTGAALALPDAPGSLVRGVLLGAPLLGAVALLSVAATDDVLVGLAPDAGFCAVPLHLDQRERTAPSAAAASSAAAVTSAAAAAVDDELASITRDFAKQSLEYAPPYEPFAVRPPSPLPHFVVPPEPTDYAAPSTLAFVAAQSAALRRRAADAQRLAGDVEARRAFLESVVVDQATELAEIDTAQRRATEAAAALDQKLERVQRLHAALLERSRGVLTILNACQAGLSDAELEWHAELRDKLRGLDQLKRSLWRLSEQTRELERAAAARKAAAPLDQLSDRQAAGVARVLEEQSREINDALERIATLQGRLV